MKQWESHSGWMGFWVRVKIAVDSAFDWKEVGAQVSPASRDNYAGPGATTVG